MMLPYWIWPICEQHDDYDDINYDDKVDVDDDDDDILNDTTTTANATTNVSTVTKSNTIIGTVQIGLFLNNGQKK